MNHQIIVGNIGTVYDGPNGHEAQVSFREYRNQSRTNYGRAAGEPVTWMKDGEPHKEHFAERPKFEIINHGYEHAQYFQGCGTSYTKFDHVATGCGNDAKEAYNDAADQIYMIHDLPKNYLPTRPHGIRKRDKVPANCQGEDSEIYYYISIRYNVPNEN